MGGAHATRRSATCCVPNGEGGVRWVNMSTSEVMVATICVVDEKHWKKSIRHTIRVRSGIGVSVRPASYVEAVGWFSSSSVCGHEG